MYVSSKLKRNKKYTFGKTMLRECWRKYVENRQMNNLPGVCECKCYDIIQITEM